MRPVKQGFSLIELLITISILGILLALAAPSFGAWMRNSRIRTTAESIQNGLQLARGEAVRRNASVRFQLTDNLDASCVLSLVSTNWVVSLDNPAGNCAAASLNEAFPINDAVNNPSPRIIQRRSAAEASNQIVAASDQLSVVFNGLGRAVPAPVTIDIKPDSNDCVNSRCLRVTVSAGGQIRMCDPAFPVTGNDPQRCN